MATVSGGAGLKAALDELSKKVAKRGALKVGFLAGATYPDGTPVAMVAAIQEFGAPKARIPPRPFFRTMVREKSPHWGAALALALQSKGYDLAPALALVGEGVAGQLRQSIIDTDDPPLSSVTLMLRQMRRQDPDLKVTGKTVAAAAALVAAGVSTAGASEKPLVDTGHMLGSVDYEVNS